MDRSGWARGTSSSLLGGAGKCCLGFYAIACGYTAKEISGVWDPYELVKKAGNKLPQGLVLFTEGGIRAQTDVCDAIIDTNDTHLTGDEEREKRLTELFEEIGVSVQFVG